MMLAVICRGCFDGVASPVGAPLCPVCEAALEPETLARLERAVWNVSRGPRVHELEEHREAWRLARWELGRPNG